MPKLDCLVDGSLKRDEILTSLGVDPSRKTVLYAPTWSAHSSLGQMAEELVKRLDAAGYAVIVKLHDRSRDLESFHSGGVDWARRLEPLLRKNGGVLAASSNSSRFLAAADVMVTDHSSVGFEFLLLDRPLIRIHIPQLIERTDIAPEYVELLASASLPALDVDEAIAGVEIGLSDPKILSESRRAVAEEMFYLPGTATARAVSELYQVLELDPPV
jgi:CDP-glycerol glycerophosphotransferase